MPHFNNYTEAETLQIIDNTVKKLARRFKFGYHEIDDIEQEARIEALKGLQKYDESRPMENFLWVHVRNRLCNFRRDNFLRPHGPCQQCEHNDNQSLDTCHNHDQKDDCDTRQAWLDKNAAKINVLYPIEFSCVDDYNEPNMQDGRLTETCVLNNELRIILNRYIPIHYRHYYLKLIYGYRVSPQYRAILIETIRGIMDEHYYTEAIADT